MTLKKKILIVIAAVVVLLIAALVIVYCLGKNFVEQEGKVRTDWEVDAGALLDTDETLQVELRRSLAQANITVLQLVPTELEDEGFTYYDAGVQDRLHQMVEEMKGAEQWTADMPLAILNPYGTGSNGLYLYFETDMRTQVSYTIHVDKEGVSDFTATAADLSGAEYTRAHEFQMIGLVPGETNEVTLTMRGSWGNLRQQVTFTIEMPDDHSGYPTLLDYTDGTSGAELSDGLFAMMRTNGYLGYGFFFDNDGVMRYEMVLEGFGMDRILSYEGDIVTCVSATRLARIDPVGRVIQVYDLDGYELHHDIVLGPGGNTVVALVDKVGSDTIEDTVVEVDLTTGTVTELVDFSLLMADYCEGETHPVSLTVDFFWQAGEWDWLHLNTVQYLEERDSLIVSSRETSTIIKVENVHTDPVVAWMAGDPAFWEGTNYEELCLTPVGDFVYQYGQHSVEYAGAGDEEGTYYIRTYNNNYWANSSRDYEPELPDGVGTSLYLENGENSYVYVYLIDENARTFSLVQSFPVPYSSIVSNAAPAGEDGNWVVNSGVAQVYGEYDSDGNLIREFAYECTMQGYRTFKLSMEGFWFQ